MQSVVFSAVLDAMQALKKASGGLPNNMVRDIQAIHANVTFADLPKDVQDAIVESTRAAFTMLLKEGYAVGPKQQMQQSRPLDRVPERDRRPRPPGDGPRRSPRPPRGDGPGRPRGDGPGRPRGDGPGKPGGGPSGPGGPNRPRRKPKGKPRLS
ncbi:hypothetical protein [Sphingomonas sabuli]|nr:hypothetical protein [Sphingomonas sabuli]